MGDETETKMTNEDVFAIIFDEMINTYPDKTV